MINLEYRIAEAITESIDGMTGNFSIEIETESEVIEVTGWYEFDGYTEDETGAWIVTYATVCITDCNVDIDTDKVERYAEAA